MSEPELTDPESELSALDDCVTAFERVDPRAWERMLEYLHSRFTLPRNIFGLPIYPAEAKVTIDE